MKHYQSPQKTSVVQKHFPQMLMPGFGTLSEFIWRSVVPLQIVYYPVFPEQPIYPQVMPLFLGKSFQIKTPVSSSLTATLLYSFKKCLHSTTCQPCAVFKADRLSALMRFCSRGVGGGYIMVDCRPNGPVMCLADSLSVS